MAKLWEVSYFARKTIRYGSIGLVVLIVGRVILTGAINLYQQLNPPPPPPTSVGFGKLPPLSFPNKRRPEIEFKLETVSGSIPTPSDRSFVYFMKVTRPSLLGQEKGNEVAANLGFVFEPEALTERLYRYSRTSPTPSRLDYDIVTGNFKLRVDWYDKSDFLKQKYLPSEKEAIREVRNYLNQADLLGKDVEDGDYKLSYLAAKGKSYKEVLSFSEADFIKIDLYREEIELGFPNITSTLDKGIVQVILSGSRNQGERVVQVQYDYFSVEGDVYETYPIKTGPQAWQELISGGGYIIQSKTEGLEVIRSSYLGYFDSYEPQNFLQPVYVFEGDDDFRAIVPAIDSSWLSQPSQ